MTQVPAAASPSQLPGHGLLQLLPDVTLVRAAQRSFLSIPLLHELVSPGLCGHGCVPQSSEGVHKRLLVQSSGFQTIPLNSTAQGRVWAAAAPRVAMQGRCSMSIILGTSTMG